jgi:transcriptional regulator with XRE-family HTH domain
LDYRDAIERAMKAMNPPWTQIDLAQAARINPSTVNRLFRRKYDPDIPQLERIAKALNKKPGDFFPRSSGADPWVERLAPLVTELQEISPEDGALLVETLATQLSVMKGWRRRSRNTEEHISRFAPQHTEPHATLEFPVEPREFIERDFDYPREFHGLEVEEADVAAGATGVNPQDMTTIVRHTKDVREGRKRVIKIVGDSMVPEFNPGELYELDVSQREPLDGEPVAVYVNDEGSIVGWWERTHTGVRLLKENNLYLPIELSSLDRNWQLIGILTACIHRPVKRRAKKK